VTTTPAVPAAAPGDPGVAFQRAEVLVELRRPTEAVEVLRSALVGHPGRADLWGQLAMALLAADRWGEAYEAAATRIQLAPEDEWGYRLASLALSAMDRSAEAVRAAAESVRLAPHEWRTHARLAHALCDDKRGDVAWPAARRAVELAPTEPETHMAVGAVAIELKQWRIADDAYRQVLALEPANAAARNNLALVALHQGGVTGAAAGFAAAVATDPQVDVARRNLEVTLRVFAARVLYCQGLLTALLWLPLSSVLVAQGVGIAAAVPTFALAAGAVLRWRALPATVRGYARSLIRGSRRYQAQAVFGLGGFCALVLAVVLAALDAIGPAQAVDGIALASTVLARFIGYRGLNRH
jgi:Flp pilus assembly protein TadD